MNDLAQRIQNTIKTQTLQDNALEEIFKKHFELDTDKHKENPGYMAWSSSAVSACVSISNLLLAVKSPESGRSFRGFCDLTYVLGANDFWSKNAGVLVPVLTVILNAQKDFVGMMVEQDQLNEYASYDTLLTGAQAVSLEIFSIILYLVGGPLLMSTASLPLKLDLAPYFLR